MSKVLLTGAGGAVGRMMRHHFGRTGLAWQEMSLRQDAAPVAIDRECRTLLHLANIARDVEANLALQERTARAIADSNITRIIVPQSFSTLAAPTAIAPDAAMFNFGFEATMRDPYPRGKIAVEKFWLDLQAHNPQLEVIFVYVPVIIGRDSQWSVKMRQLPKSGALLVPRISRLFTVLQDDLARTFTAVHRRPARPGVGRMLAVSASGSLADAIRQDWPGWVREYEPGRVTRSLCALAERFRPVDRLLLAAQRILFPAWHAVGGQTILELSPQYLGLFLRQERIAGRLAPVPATARPRAVPAE